MTLRARFALSHPAKADALPDEAALHQALTSLHAAGHAAWPGLTVPEDALAEHLARRWPGAPDAPDPCAWMAGLDAAGLVLCCGCLLHHPAALALFESQILAQVGRYLAGLSPRGPRDVFEDEVRQQLREKLLVGAPPAPPRLADYSGQGALGSFVRVIAVRAGLDLLRRGSDKREVAFDEDRALLALGAGTSGAPGDLELLYVKDRYRAPLRAALGAALASLSREDRNLMRLHYLEHLSIDRLGELFHIHRATAARRLQQVRERVLSAVQEQARAQLQLEGSELAEVLQLVQSNLELSLSRLLASQTAP